jgi:hypothetical protein
VPFDFKILNKGNIDGAGSVTASVEKTDGTVLYKKDLSRKSYLYARNHLTFQGALKVKGLGTGYRNFEVVFKYKDWKGNIKELRKSVGFLSLPLSLFYAILFVIAILILFASYQIDARLRRKGEAFKQIG